jgi:hypothetical protein
MCLSKKGSLLDREALENHFGADAQPFIRESAATRQAHGLIHADTAVSRSGANTAKRLIIVGAPCRGRESMKRLDDVEIDALLAAVTTEAERAVDGRPARRKRSQ